MGMSAWRRSPQQREMKCQIPARSALAGGVAHANPQPQPLGTKIETGQVRAGLGVGWIHVAHVLHRGGPVARSNEGKTRKVPAAKPMELSVEDEICDDGDGLVLPDPRRCRKRRQGMPPDREPNGATPSLHRAESPRAHQHIDRPT